MFGANPGFPASFGGGGGMAPQQQQPGGGMFSPAAQQQQAPSGFPYQFGAGDGGGSGSFAMGTNRTILKAKRSRR